MKKIPIGQNLVENGFLKETQLNEALEKQKEDWESNNRQYNKCIDLTKSIDSCIFIHIYTFLCCE